MSDRCRCGLPPDASLGDALRDRFDQLIGWAKAGEVHYHGEPCYLMATENVRTLRDDLIGAVLEEMNHHITQEHQDRDLS